MPVRKAKSTSADQVVFIAQIEEVAGSVEVETERGSVKTKAGIHQKLDDGDALTTAAGAGAKVVVRSVGTVVVHGDSRLVFLRNGPVAVVVARGRIELVGAPGYSKKRGSLLHTPAAAIEPPLEKVLVEVSDDGRVAIGATGSAVTHIDLQARRQVLKPGTKVVMDAVDNSGGGGDGAHLLLVQASKLASRLELDIERLIELKELNRSALERRRQLALSGSESSAGDLEKLNARFAEQAREMVELKELGLLGFYRTIALMELAGVISPGNRDSSEQIKAIEQRLESMRNKLPDLFQRR